MNFIPIGWQDDKLPLVILEKLEYENYSFVICSYGAMYGVFHYVTGGKVCDISVYDHPGHTETEYLEACKQKAFDTLDYNPNWHNILDGLPILN